MTGKLPPQKKSKGLLRRHFEGDTSEVMNKINASIDVDKRLYAQDIAGSQAHCQMLVGQGILSSSDGAAIEGGLQTILAEIEAGKMLFDPAL